MASTMSRGQTNILMIVFLLALNAPLGARAHAQLSTKYYDSTCPNLEKTVRSAFQTALSSDERIGASLTRMHFHDCFVNGCDASVLLSDNDATSFVGEQTAQPNGHSLRGFDVVENIKSSVESVCAATVSCADILALVAREAVVAAGGPYWEVELGRRDSTTASLSEANLRLPQANDTLDINLSKFSYVGLDIADMVALTGAHTFGKAQCATYSQIRLYNYSNTGKPDPTIDPTYLSVLQARCPNSQDMSVKTTLLDPSTPTTFDNSYYVNLLQNKGLLLVDQQMESNGGKTAKLVKFYSRHQDLFFAQFAWSMVKMGNIGPLTGNLGQIRTTCSKVNYKYTLI